MSTLTLGADCKKIYFIGIGGINMSGLAEILHADGYAVSGSDQRGSETTKRLQGLGIPIFIGHAFEHVTGDMDIVVYTAAVRKENPEYQAAEQKSIRLMERAELLGLLMKNYKFPICISGTHGKTTTTSMLAEVFMAADTDPTIMNGGILGSIGGAMRNGAREYFIAESCEYHDSFLKLFPYIGIILNVEKDHTDYFLNLENIRKSFRKFSTLIPAEGALVINAGITDIGEMIDGLACRVATYGEGGDWTAASVEYNKNGFASFEARYQNKPLGRVSLNVPGEHNVGNALAVCAAASALQIEFSKIAMGLYNFTGANRRFQQKGKCNGVTVIDDYAHHPTEIKATLAAAKNIDCNRLWSVFQPHTHSRTQELLVEFSESFDDADEIIILDIYSPAGREEENLLVHATDLVQKIKARGKRVHYFSTFFEAEEFILKNCINNDMLITMGAGDVYKLGEDLISNCQ